jgi:hypothetical protein
MGAQTPDWLLACIADQRGEDGVITACGDRVYQDFSFCLRHLVELRAWTGQPRNLREVAR